jgi:hypothetical protein
MAHALAAKSLMMSGSAWNIAVRPDRDKIHRLFVMEMVSPRGRPETATADRFGRLERPESLAKAVIELDMVGWSCGSYSRTLE